MVRIAPLPAELANCAPDPQPPLIGAVDWSGIEAARATALARDRATLSYILALRAAGGDCRAKVAGVAAWNRKAAE